MAEPVHGNGAIAGRPSFFARLMARLRGEGGPVPAQDEAPPVGGRARHGRRGGPLDPLTVRQWLWGPGFIIPGNAEYVLGLVKPFAPNPAMSFLDVAAGLGGPARAIATAFDIYITGLERDDDVARRGMEMSIVRRQAEARAGERHGSGELRAQGRRLRLHPRPRRHLHGAGQGALHARPDARPEAARRSCC